MKNFIQNIFSVKNDKDIKHKKIKLFGLTIKLKKINNKNNKIYLVDAKQNKKRVRKIKGLKVIFRGNNSVIELGSDPLIEFRSSKIEVGNNCHIKIGSSRYFAKMSVVSISNGSKLIIGNDFSCAGAYIDNKAEPNLSIEIGDDCMFSSDIQIRVSDGHTIYLNDKTIINKPTGIKIGNHCWLCNSVKILKNTVIPDKCIIGNSTLVNKIYSEENSIIAGIPSKIVKRNVNWDRRHTYQYEREELCQK